MIGRDVSDELLLERKRLVLRHLESENNHDLPQTLATLTQNCTFEDHGLQRRFRGHDGATQYYRLWWEAFGVVVGQDAHQAGLQWTEDGNAFAEARYRGRHRGTFLGIPPTGNLVELRFVVIVSFREDRMDGERFYYDLAQFLSQLGSREHLLPVALAAAAQLPHSEGLR